MTDIGKATGSLCMQDEAREEPGVCFQQFTGVYISFRPLKILLGASSVAPSSWQSVLMQRTCFCDEGRGWKKRRGERGRARGDKGAATELELEMEQREDGRHVWR